MMVDSEDMETSSGHLVSIAEDNEYFKRMWSLVPPIRSEVEEPAEDSQENLKALAKMEKKAQKEKKKEKRRIEGKLIHPDTKKESKAAKHISDGDAEHTVLKLKKQKLSNSTESAPALTNQVSAMDATDGKNQMFSNGSDPRLSVSSSPGNKISMKYKHKHKHSAKNTVHSDSEQVQNVSTTLKDANKGPSTSCVMIPGDLADADMLEAASINNTEDKREKLRAKIAELQAKRNPTNRERFERKKLKRQENKMKLKQKRKLEKLQKKQGKQDGDGSKPVKGNLNKGASTPVKPVFNKEGQMVFSKFDFTDSTKKEKKKSDLHGKDYKRLLEKIEKRNEKINKVKSKDESAGKALEEKFKWESALHKAEGEKVKDNPDMLKKALKRKQKMKEQKKKKWEKRVEHVDKMKEDKQKKRTDNIQKRKQNMKDKKIQKLKKKGRLVAGF